MAALMMSIGFSVDISAHVSYHIYEVHDKSDKTKLARVLQDIAWPTVQGSLATFLCLMPILIRRSYMGMVFFKVHALI